MNRNLMDTVDLGIRDAVFEECHFESSSAIISCLAEHKSLDVVEYDFPLRIADPDIGQYHYDMLADKISYVDGESFRIDFSESNFSREKYDAMSAEERVSFRIDRLGGHTHSILVCRGDWQTPPWVAIYDLVRLRFLVEFLVRVGDAEFDDRAFEEEIETKAEAEIVKVILSLKRK